MQMNGGNAFGLPRRLADDAEHRRDRHPVGGAFLSRGAIAVSLLLMAGNGTAAWAGSTTPDYPASHNRAASHRVASSSFQASSNVLIAHDTNTPGTGGDLQTSGAVLGEDTDNFDDFSFGWIAVADVDSTALAGYDTLVLDQVLTDHLSGDAKQAISGFVTAGAN